MHRSSRQPLFDAVTRRLVLQRRYGNDVNALRQRVAPPRHVIPAADTPRRNTYERNSNPPLHGTNFSASFTAFHAGNRILSAAPQNHQMSRRPESCSGAARWMDVPPATLTLLGASSELAAITKPADLHAASIFSKFNPDARGSNAAEATKAVP